ncbi:inversin [Rhincodon typus]|uniref:inversin n=1 Tax=Rhincodon typus TaxID=259920 RepID=UPI00202DF9A4|nr:inversin [Rhincodon typus]
MKLLLSRRANWMQKDLEEMTPLHLATRHKSPKCLALLLKSMAPGEVDTQDKNKQTALHWSAYYNHPEHVKLLIKHDSNIGIPDIEGKIPLHWAASNKDTTAIHTVKCILEAAPTESLLNWQDYEGRTPLHFAVADGNDAVVDVLTLYEGCNITSYDNLFRTPLHWAALLGHAQIGHLLLERNKSGTIPSDSQGATPLHYAAQSNFAETVEVFLNHPSVKDDPDLEGRTAFMWAAGKGSDDVLRTMLRVKSDIDINMADKYGGTVKLSDETPQLFLLIIGGSRIFLSRLGTDCNRFDIFQGRTALHWSCNNGYLEAVKLLLGYSAFPNHMEINEERFTPLDYALLGEHQEVIQYMLEHGALSIAAIQDIAASKIQAVYKGYMVRKAFQERKNLLMKHEQLRKDAAKKREEENKRKEAEIQKEQKRLESELNVQQRVANLEISCQLADLYPVNGESTSPTISEHDQLELRTRKDFKRSSKSKSEKTATIRPLLQTWRSVDTIQSHTSSIETGKREMKNGKELTRKSSKGNRVNDHHPYNERSIPNELQSCRQLTPSEKGDANTENDGRIPESARRSNGCKSKPAGFRSASATKKSVKQQNPPPLICGRHHKITSESSQEYEVPWAKCSRFSPAGSSRPGSAKSVIVNSTDNAMQTSTQCSDTITSVLHPRACPKPRSISGMYNYAIENAPRDRTGSSQSPSTDNGSFTTLNDRSSDIQLIPLEIRVQIVEKERLRKELFRKKNKAAAVIQRAWKSYRIRKTLLLLLRWRCQNGDNVDKTWKQEVAAFTIQLIWRKNLSGSVLNGISRKSSQTFNSRSSCTRAAKQHSVLKQIYGKPQEEKGHNSQQSSPFRNGHISVQKMSGAPVKGIFRRVRSACSTSLSSTYHSQLTLDLTTFNGHTDLSKLQHVQLLGNTGNSKQFSYNMRPHTSKTSKARPKE